MIALTDLLRQVSTMHAAAPCRKRLIQVAAASALWLTVAAVMLPFSLNPVVTPFARVIMVCTVCVWTPSMIACAWFNTPSAAAATRPIKRSRAAALYERYASYDLYSAKCFD